MEVRNEGMEVGRVKECTVNTAKTFLSSKENKMKI